MNELLEMLATRGTPRGADAVLGAAITSVDGGSQNGDSSGAAAAARALDQRDLQVLVPDALDGPPVVNLEVAELRRRRPWRTALTAGGLAAMLGVVSLGVSSLLGGGGSNSPEGAVRQLADAIEHEDPLAAVDVLAPDEVQALRASVDGISQRAAELQLVDDAGRPLAGVDFEVGDLALDTETLAPGYAKVNVHGLAISAAAHRESLADLIQRAWTDENATTRSTISVQDIPPDIGTFVIAVERDGGWYVSPAYTALEYVRVVNDLPAAEYGSGRTSIQALGADTPEAAVHDALAAFSTGDWNRLWQLAPPDEIPVYDYRAALDQALADTDGPNFTIDEFSATADVAGDRANVSVQARGVSEGGAAWSVDDQCFTVDYPDDDTSFDSMCSPADLVRGFTLGGPLFTAAGEDEGGRPLHVTAVRRGDRWFVSPVGTVLDLVDSAVRSVDKNQLLAALGLYGELTVDGEATLDQPTSGTTNAAVSMHVYTLQAQAGQRIVGAFTSSSARQSADDSYVSALLIQPDGTETYDSYNLFSGPGLTVRVGGTYRVVMWVPVAGDFTFTVYDSASAPADLLDRELPGFEVSESCQQLSDGSTDCSSIGSAGGTASPLFSSSVSGSDSSGGTTETSIATSATTLAP